MPWLQLHINTSRDAAHRIEFAMQRQGALSITLEDNADEPIFEPELGETPLWQETRVTGLFEADIESEEIRENIIKACQIEESSAQWQILEDKDWQREWMQYFKPIDCGFDFWICPSWIEPPKPNATNLLLDPGLAFGTGTHPTTFLCLKWIAQTNVKGASIIDYGCGSGILGIASLLRGAKDVLGTDIDPQALLATRENVIRNQLPTESFPIVFPDKCPDTPKDFVFANILAGPLVELAPKLIKLLKPGGKICLSGILNTQKEAIIEAYRDAIDIDAVYEKDEWICIAGSRKNL